MVLRALLASGCAAAPPAHAQSVRAVSVSDGYITPTFVCSAPGDASRLYVGTSTRGIWLLKHNLRQGQMFLDLLGDLPNGEGLLGMAFDPDHASNGRFFVALQDVSGDSWLVEYRVSSDPDLADPSSARTILGPVHQPDDIHNWNSVAFGPDGMLYLSTGDGGFTNDPNDQAQDLGSLFGKILRLDPDLPAPYVPADNPFVGRPGVREEIWAYGLRQPWKLAFDRATGDLYIGDVGEGQREEIDFQPAASQGGENYGWRCMEGTNCTGTGACACDHPGWVRPIHEFAHDGGRCAVVGGCVYRGSAIPGLQGTYFFGDFCSGDLYSFRYDGTLVADFQDRSQELVPCTGSAITGITAFGEDSAGEIYFTTLANARLYKLVPSDRTAFEYCAKRPNSTGVAARIGFEGTTRIGADDFELTVSGAVPGQNGLFYYGSGQAETPFGHGFRCVSGQTFRLNPPIVIGPGGSASRRVDFRALAGGPGEIAAGSAHSFQFWYRDPAAGPPGFNLSNGLRVEFCP